ncbi:polyhydroxyalkanoic acid system family protein [Alteraurantiacibacter aquimixticola]|uniref:Polyhydroxyalkanoic acid synthase n=1 Tax=Alteraurantiacibacter aquimixticola TaxID=2489173 RepID=A0A4T3EYD8_9SPHN|nr:polyhydroxyalkanoic acid system family protein [Alteraurantiacibacter aquimixticola]TIX49541.1 hypothetical protein E5222_11900 [Alteraurantiacibacter aquimixticola]
MQVAIPHQLGREEVRRRLKSNSHSIADAVPGGMAEVTTDWPSEDRMVMNIKAMGQDLTGHVDIADSEVVFVVELPAALGFIKPMVEGAIRQQGERLVAPPREDKPADES